MGSAAKDKERLVFGLSLDNKVEWCLGRNIKKDDEWIEPEGGSLISSGEFKSPIDTRYEDDFEGFLRRKILELKNIRPEMENVSAIGISIVGTADRSKLQFVNIARQDFGKPSVRPIIDFRRLFEGIFPNIDLIKEPGKIEIQNESTAKCLAEWRRMKAKGGKGNSLLYVMFSRGVNCSFVSNNYPINTELHPEFGHAWPRVHRLDLEFNPEYTGCRVHKYCFEGLASSLRIYKNWGNGSESIEEALSEFKKNPEARDIIAFYIGQMIMQGVVAFSPAKVRIGGDIVFEELIKEIEEYFYYFNCGGGREFYPDYDAMHADDFIRMAEIKHEAAGIAAALELARRVGMPKNKDKESGGNA